jgi:hypothetical protein
VPDKLTTDALVEALKRGVRVRIPRPGPIIDTDVVRRASRAAMGAAARPRAPRSTSSSRRCSTAR